VQKGLTTGKAERRVRKTDRRVAGVEPPETIIGGGIVGASAARIALGWAPRSPSWTATSKAPPPRGGAPRKAHHPERRPARRRGIRGEADLLIGAVLVKGARTPRVVTRAMVARMARGSVVDRRLRRFKGGVSKRSPDETLRPGLLRRGCSSLRGHEHAGPSPDEHDRPVERHPALRRSLPPRRCPRLLSKNAIWQKD